MVGFREMEDVLVNGDLLPGMSWWNSQNLISCPSSSASFAAWFFGSLFVLSEYSLLSNGMTQTLSNFQMTKSFESGSTMIVSA